MQEAAFDQIVKYGLTTRQTEKLVQEMIAGGTDLSEAAERPRKPISFRRTQHGFRLRVEYDRRFHQLNAVLMEMERILRDIHAAKAEIERGAEGADAGP